MDIQNSIAFLNAATNRNFLKYIAFIININIEIYQIIHLIKDRHHLYQESYTVLMNLVAGQE